MFIGELKDFGIWTRTGEGIRFMSQFGEPQSSSFHVFGGLEEYLIFEGNNEGVHWEAVRTCPQGLGDGSHFIDSLGQYSHPANVIYFGDNQGLKRIRDLLSKQPDFKTNTRVYGPAYTFLNAHEQL